MTQSRWWIALAAAGLLFMLPTVPAHAGVDTKTYLIFGGSNTDSTEQASQWFPVQGASRVYIRLWTEHAAFSANNADSAFSDSLTTFKVLVSDTLVNAQTGFGGVGGQNNVLGGADSLMYDATVASTQDSSIVMRVLPINRPLRMSGFTTDIMAAGSGATLAPDYSPVGVFPRKVMRIRVTPLRRSTASGGQSTQGKRVNGLKSFKGVATVIYNR